MSRIGKIPVDIPSGVTVNVNAEEVSVKGPIGEVKQKLVPQISIKVEDDKIIVAPTDNSKQGKSLHGLYRSLINNMVIGVTQGYVKGLRIVGTGYRVELQGKTLVISAGYCHPVNVEAPEGVEFEIPKGTSREYMDFNVKGCDKQMVMEIAARVRRVRPPNLYQGKGIRYADETPRRLEGKSFGSA